MKDTGSSLQGRKPTLNKNLIQRGSRVLGGVGLLSGILLLILAPFVGKTLFDQLWAVEPLAYIGTVLLGVGLVIITLSYVLPHLAGRARKDGANNATRQNWGQLTQHYFELFEHDLGRPLRQILGKQRELVAVLKASEQEVEPALAELIEEIDKQAPDFQLMVSNIRVLVELESPDSHGRPQPVEPAEVVRKIVDRYASVAATAGKGISWWTEPAEFGIIYSDSSDIEHIVANLVDNAVRFATASVELKITKNPTHFFIRVWDDGPGIAPQYAQHIFERGWTPEVARRQEKSTTGLGLFIARTLANRCGGDLTVESVQAPDPHQHTVCLLSLPLGGPSNTPVTMSKAD